ncbi:hypothetical protein THRCLA_10100 [Thraustotheca clavata]|uniref:Uncharacterized protein n=1 Tax=Thraustotheca clavata TaxID=74557 RepID=A0A1V9YSR4_9STRA|nr:hypothetical protein THRCLA_10100 [Thraustotheca clavata]
MLPFRLTSTLAPYTIDKSSMILSNSRNWTTFIDKFDLHLHTVSACYVNMLTISNCSLEQTPLTLEHLNQVWYLSLINNTLNISSNLTQLLELSYLTIHQTSSQQIPSMLERLPSSLSTMNLSCTNFSNWPDWIQSSWAKVTRLHFISCLSVKILESILKLREMTILDLSQNHLKSLSDTIWPKLTTLILSGNQLQDINESIFILSSLQNLALDGNNISSCNFQPSINLVLKDNPCYTC